MEPVKPDPKPDADTTLVNGVRISGALASKLALNVNDPMAVLALALVADGTEKVRARAKERAGLLKAFETATGQAGSGRELHRPSAVIEAVKKADVDLASLQQRKQAAVERVAAARREMETAEEPFRRLQSSREAHRAMLWWFGIGWLIWTLSGKAEQYRHAEQELQEKRQKLSQTEEQKTQVDQAIEKHGRIRAALVAIQELDARPLDLLRTFGWSHVPLEVKPSPQGDARLVFTSIWNPNFKHQFPEIPDGIERVEALRDQLVTNVDPPILLSPTTDDSPALQGLTGEELLLARNIDTFAELMDSASNVPLQATLLPSDQMVDQQLRAWASPARVARDRIPWCFLVPDPAASDIVVRFMERARLERMQPDESLFKRLEGVVVSLRDQNEFFAKWRTESIESMLGAIVREWSGWTTLPLRRRYCPSFHRVPAYRYHKLGFAIEDAFDHKGRFPHRDKLERLPDPRPVVKKLDYYEEQLEDTGDANALTGLREEILHMIRQRVEGTKIVGLSAAATLKYNLTTQRWRCGLCLHERRIGAPGTPEQHLGCPEGGLFSDDEARMAEQYVHYEDLLIPMLSALWHEKSTHDEINRILRETEAELRRNVLEEQQALRDEGRIFKEDARDRLVALEDLHGKAQEVRERLSEEIDGAHAMGAIDASRRQELSDELREYGRKLTSVGAVKEKVTQHEDYLVDDVEQTESRRQVVLEERVRRSSDAPQFIHLTSQRPPKLFGVQRRQMTAGGDAQADYLLVRKASDTSSFQRFTLQEVAEWLRDPANAREAAGLEVNDGAAGVWRPMLEHPSVRRSRPELRAPEPDQFAAVAAEAPPPPPGVDDEPPPPPRDADDEPPPPPEA